MTANSSKTRKAKGRKFQQEIGQRIADVLGVEFGKDMDVDSRPMGQSGPDIILHGTAAEEFPFVVETKFQEKWNIHDWIKQAKSHGEDWLLFCKRSRSDPIVCMSVDTFFDLYGLLIYLADLAEQEGLLNED